MTASAAAAAVWRVAAAVSRREAAFQLRSLQQGSFGEAGTYLRKSCGEGVLNRRAFEPWRNQYYYTSIRRMSSEGGTVIKVHSEEEFTKYMSTTGTFGASSTVIVDFTATWCGPCQQIAPKFEALAKEHPSVIFLKVDVDELQELARELGVRAMPTFMTFIDGKKKDEVVGANLNQLRNVVKGLAALSSVSTGEGQKVGGGGGDGGNAGAEDADERRSRLAAAAENRMKGAAV